MADDLVALNALAKASPAPAAEIDDGTPWPTKTNYIGVVTPAGTPARKAAAVPPPEPGDALIDRARARADFGSEEKADIQLFVKSKRIIDEQIKADPAYEQALLGRLGGLKGEKLAMGLVDEADQLKIQFMKNANPEHFNSAEAAKGAFFNTVTFGQLSRIMGGAGQLLQGRPWAEVAEEQGEKFRLMAKAFPAANFTGEAAAFMIPGSPVKAVFEKAAGIGGKAIGKILERVTKSPTLWGKVLESAGAGASGAGAVGTIQGGLGSGTEPFSFDRMQERADVDSTGGAALGALLPLIGAGARPVAGMVRATATKAKGVVADMVGELSGTRPAALRAYNANPEKLAKAAGTEGEIGADLVDYLLDRRKSRVAEVDAADQLLDQLPDVDPGPLMKFLRSHKTGINPKLDAPVTELGEWAKRIEDSIGPVPPAGLPHGKIPARVMREFVDQFQDAAEHAYGKEAPMLATALKVAGRRARLSIVDTAKAEGGAAGIEYDQLMQKAAEKVGVLQYLTRQLGHSAEEMARRSQGFTDRVFGRNQEFTRARLADLDSKFGTNFMERMQSAQNAQELGAEGIPSWFSNHQTGKSTLGMQVGETVGGVVGGAAGIVLGSGHGAGGAGVAGISGHNAGKVVGKAVGAAASSPRLGAMLVGTSDNISGFLRMVTANPEALSRLASRASAGSNAAMAARLRVPIEIQHLADQISTTLTKDGPQSAGSVVRLIADTPYFAGLVHYFDLAERAQQEKRMGRVIPTIAPKQKGK